MQELIDKMKANHDKLISDAETMAMRLMGEDDSTFSPECAEVMKRWRKHLAAKHFLGLMEQEVTNVPV
jgi:hypothetical protein